MTGPGTASLSGTRAAPWQPASDTVTGDRHTIPSARSPNGLGGPPSHPDSTGDLESIRYQQKYAGPSSSLLFLARRVTAATFQPHSTCNAMLKEGGWRHDCAGSKKGEPKKQFFLIVLYLKFFVLPSPFFVTNTCYLETKSFGRKLIWHKGVIGFC